MYAVTGGQLTQLSMPRGQAMTPRGDQEQTEEAGKKTTPS